MILGDVIRLTREKHTPGAHVMADVDEQMRQVARPPQHAREDDQSAGLAEERRNRRRALGVESCRDLSDKQQQQDDRHEAEQL